MTKWAAKRRSDRSAELFDMSPKRPTASSVDHFANTKFVTEMSRNFYNAAASTVWAGATEKNGSDSLRSPMR
jgi:hypothetical protein